MSYDINFIILIVSLQEYPDVQNWKTALETLDGAYADATMRAYQADIQAYVA